MAGSTTTKAKHKSSGGSGTSSVTLGPVSSQLNADISSAPAGVVQDIIAVARNVAKSMGFNQQQTLTLEETSLATSAVETGGTYNPQSVGDSGTSFGLFQLHQGGELGSMTEQQAFDPVQNAETAIPGIAQQLKASGFKNPGTAAAAAQRPADQAGYASSVDALLAGPGLSYGGVMGGASFSGPTVTGVPNTVTVGMGATGNAGVTGVSTTTGGSSLSTGLLAKVGGFIFGALLVGIGIIVLFKDDEMQLVEKAAK